jgi:hypothetical protein
VQAVLFAVIGCTAVAPRGLLSSTVPGADFEPPSYYQFTVFELNIQ